MGFELSVARSRVMQTFEKRKQTRIDRASRVGVGAESLCVSACRYMLHLPGAATSEDPAEPLVGSYFRPGITDVGNETLL